MSRCAQPELWSVPTAHTSDSITRLTSPMVSTAPSFRALERSDAARSNTRNTSSAPGGG